jgi:hydroxymethylbilane synthase
LHRYPTHHIENLRGNVNTRLRKLSESEWTGAIFAAAGLERIGLRPDSAVELDWMLPAPAQGAILIACLDENDFCIEASSKLNDPDTALCTKIERDFLRGLLGGCSTPISALAEIDSGDVYFRGSILSPDGKQKLETEKILPVGMSDDIGIDSASELLQQDEQKIIERIRHANK